jgi:nucleotide-binding universal stress UspA family protein
VAKIIVGVERSERSEDAVALATLLARGSDAELVLVSTYPYDAAIVRFSDGGAFDRRMREEAEAMIAHAAQGAAGVEHVRPLTVAASSPAKGLQQAAEHERPALVVLGSSHRGKIARVLAGTTAERLLHGAPCPVAVAPLGFREHAEERIATIGVAYDGSEEATAALAAAVSLARPARARLRVIQVLDTVTMSAPGYFSGPVHTPPTDEMQAHALARLAGVLEELDDDIAAEPVVLTGDAERELADRTADLDLMITGSRGYGPLGAVFLGSVSGRLVRDAHCPVLVVPRGQKAPLEELFGAQAAGHGV